MDDKIVAIYAIVSDFLMAIHHYEDPQRQMSDAEVMTTAIVAALFFAGNYESARNLLAEEVHLMLTTGCFTGGAVVAPIYCGLVDGYLALSQVVEGIGQQLAVVGGVGRRLHTGDQLHRIGRVAGLAQVGDVTFVALTSFLPVGGFYIMRRLQAVAVELFRRPQADPVDRLYPVRLAQRPLYQFDGCLVSLAGAQLAQQTQQQKADGQQVGFDFFMLQPVADVLRRPAQIGGLLGLPLLLLVGRQAAHALLQDGDEQFQPVHPSDVAQQLGAVQPLPVALHLQMRELLVGDVDKYVAVQVMAGRLREFPHPPPEIVEGAQGGHLGAHVIQSQGMACQQVELQVLAHLFVRPAKAGFQDFRSHQQIDRTVGPRVYLAVQWREHLLRYAGKHFLPERGGPRRQQALFHPGGHQVARVEETGLSVGAAFAKHGRLPVAAPYCTCFWDLC